MKKVIVAITALLFAAVCFSDISIAGDKKRYKKGGYKVSSISRVDKPNRQRIQNNRRPATSDFRPSYNKPKNKVQYRQNKNGGQYRPPNPGESRPNRHVEVNRNHYSKKHGGTWNYNYKYEYENKTKFYNDPYFWGSVAGVVGGVVNNRVYVEPGPVYAEPVGPVCETYWVDYYDEYYQMWSKQPVQQCQ